MILVADVLIFVHEFGHFVAARSLGMPVTSFSVSYTHLTLPTSDLV